ncbi:hypothetical protein HNR60_001603 [Rhodopseudomonas rhenobacensis]|uniref:Uncharacterized protein n=1 Tax=Rhodopseudomonas rhenobacensis TaxID=87461 RepID=A0A7W7Z2P6_9BRAD|nr:hypothetical protein [Rhodopseudomonas rhenobacensis]MBB5046854.1 hypothetical protein [Rhodopseudomonas rhenobacensis]
MATTTIRHSELSRTAPWVTRMLAAAPGRTRQNDDDDDDVIDIETGYEPAIAADDS